MDENKMITAYSIDEQLANPIDALEPYEPPDITVDRAVVAESGGKWYVRGTRNGAEVAVMGGWATQAEHVAAKLYDASGAEVPHELPGQELSDVEVLMLAVAEIAEIVEGIRVEMEAPK